ncbi:MAG: porin family protein [Candidatus Cryptobacteroides sp.]
MSENDHSRFDLEIKALMDSAEEEVPQRVWESVCERLDSAGVGKKPVVPFLSGAAALWLRRAAAGVAVAAAVAGAVILVPWGGGHPGESAEDLVAAGTGADYVDVVPEDAQGGVLLADVPSEEIPDVPSSGHSEMPEGVLPGGSGVEDAGLFRPSEIPSAASAAMIPDGGMQDASSDGDVFSDEAVSSDEGASSEFSGGEVETDPAVAVGGNAGTGSGRDATVEDAADESTWVDADEPSGRKPFKAALNISGNAMTNTQSGGMSKYSSQSFSRPGIPSFGAEQVALKTITETGSSSYGIPVSFGVGAKFFIGRRWAVGAGLNYTIMTRSFNGIYIDPATSSSIGLSDEFKETKIRNSVSYIGIPVNAYFSIIRTNIVDFYVYAGGSAEKCVANVYRMQEPVATYKENVNGFQFSVGAGLGVEFVVADILGIYADPSVRYYFKDASQPKSIRTENPVSFGFEIGLRIRL